MEEPCSKCGGTERYNPSGKAKIGNCKTCARAWYQNNSSYFRRYSLKKYGLTPETFQEKLVSQDMKCAICKVIEPKGGGTWHVDHNHLSMAVRGLLCNNCNMGLGLFEDNPEILRSAASYLEFYGTE